MKKVIDGKMYNTETAELLFKDSYTSSEEFNGKWCDYDTIREFYKKKNGEFFTLEYTFNITNNDIDKSSICFDTDEEEVKNMAAIWMDGDQYVSIFGPVEE